jgi:hypothetical protein
MNVKTIIKNYVLGLGSPPPTFIMGTKGYQNLVADKVKVWPVAFLDHPLVNQIRNMQGGRIQRKYNCTIAFLDKIKFDSTAEQHDVIIEQMRDLATGFIQAVSKEIGKEDKLLTFDLINEREGINIFNVNLTGVILNFEIIPFESESFC